MKLVTIFSHSTRWHQQAMMACWTTLLLLLCLSLQAEAGEKKVENFEINNPRAFAYHIGDTLTRTIHLQLRKPYQLKTERLPKKTRMGRWLAVTASDYTINELASSIQYDIVLSYQVINIIPELKELVLPRHYLDYSHSETDDEGSGKLEVPPVTVGISTITNANKHDIQAAVKPRLLRQDYTNLLVYGALLLMTLAGLAYLLFGSPFSKKDQPFSDALSLLKKIKQQRWDELQNEKALKIIHQAFNSTAKKTVFADKTDAFFLDQKQFLPLQAEVESFFIESKQYFFKQTDSSEGSTLDDLIDFVKSCRHIEKGQW